MGSTASSAAAGAAAGSTFAPWGTVIGGLAGALGAGRKKAAPAIPFSPVNIQQAQTDAIKGNLAAEGDIERMISKASTYQQGLANQLLEQAVPGYGAFSQKLLETGKAALDNPYALPADVQANLERIAAEKGVSVGTQGQTRQFSALRDLGQNMLEYGNNNISRAITALSTVTGIAPRVSPVSPLQFYITPQQQVQNAQFNATEGQRIGQMQSDDRTNVRNANSASQWQDLIQGLTGALGQIKTGKDKG